MRPSPCSGIDALYAPAGGEPVLVRVIARRPDTIVAFGETRIHAETATFEVRANEVADPRPDDQLTVAGDKLRRAGRAGTKGPGSAAVDAGCASGLGTSSGRDALQPASDIKDIFQRPAHHGGIGGNAGPVLDADHTLVDEASQAHPAQRSPVRRLQIPRKPAGDSDLKPAMIPT
jgi:hypothetical protein